MALPATDNFNRADDGLGANWTTGPRGAPSIVSNEVRGSALEDAYWNADTPNNDQYAEITVAAAGNYCGAAVRASATDWVGMDAAEFESKWILEWYNGGAYTEIGSWATSPNNGDVARIEVEGTTYTGYVNGTQRIQGSNASAPASGYGGLFIESSSDHLDDFEVGNMAAGLSIPVAMAGYQRRREQ